MLPSNVYRGTASVSFLLLAVLIVHALIYQALMRRLTVKRARRNGNWSQEECTNNQKLRAALQLVESNDYKLNFNESSPASVTGSGRYVIPNIVHYVRHKRPSFTFTEYVCLRSAYVKQRPQYIFIHTDSYDSLRGKYWRWIREERDLFARVVLLPLHVPSEVFGRKLSQKYGLYHGTDVARLQVVLKYGGIYLDNDMFVVNSLDKYRKLEMAVSWPVNGTVGNMIVIANRNARFLARWLDNYRDYKPDLWYEIHFYSKEHTF